MEFLYLFLFIVFIFVDYLVAKAFEEIAAEKGFTNHSKYFWFSFMLGPIGHLMTVALPDKKARAIAAASIIEKTTELPVEEKKKEEVIPDELRF